MDRHFAELLTSVSQALRVCKVQPEEKVVIFADTAIEAATVDAFYTAALNVGTDPVIVTIKTRPRFIMDPPKSAEAAMADADVVFDLATQPWLYTDSLNRILASGARMLECGFVPQRILIRRPPLEVISARETAAHALLAKCKTFRIYSDEGTDITMERGSRPIHTQGGTVDHPGDWDNYAVSLAAFAPPEDKANGTVFLNGTLYLDPDNLVLQQPIQIAVENGRLTHVKEDHYEARLLSQWLASWDDPNSYVIAHTGFGLDHRAKVQDLDTSAWESILGGVNIAFGTNNSPHLGGQTMSVSHLDAVLLNVNVEVDGALIIDHGKFTKAAGIPGP